jgi:hypothetical protein
LLLYEEFMAGQSHEKCIIVVCGITAAAIENPIGSASEPIFGDANHKNPVACGRVAQVKNGIKTVARSASDVIFN